MRGFNQLEGIAKNCVENINIFTGLPTFDLVSIRETRISVANFRFSAVVKFCSTNLVQAR